MPRPPTPRLSLTQTIAGADAALTLLDDRIDVEDRAIWGWLRAHEVHRNHHHHLVIGYEPLPPAWRARVLRVPSVDAANRYMQPLWREAADTRALAAVYREANPGAPAPVGPALQTAVSEQLFSGKLWAIEATDEPHSRFVSRTSPSAFAPINPRLGTSVDFAHIARLEGDQWLRGYIPFKRSGIVAGRSGMTVASGFDVGQWGDAEIRALGFPPDLLAKLLPFANHPFKGRTREAVAQIVATLGPVPILTKAEADLCDGAVFMKILRGAKAAFDAGRANGVPAFVSLPGGWQTVWLSRYYQEGPSTAVALGQVFRCQAMAGEWTAAVATLRSYTQYGQRAREEADLLGAAMPAEIVRPAARAPAR